MLFYSGARAVSRGALIASARATDDARARGPAHTRFAPRSRRTPRGTARGGRGAGDLDRPPFERAGAPETLARPSGGSFSLRGGVERPEMATETRGGGVALARQMNDSSSPASWDYDVLSVAESGGVSLRHIAFDVFAQEGLVARFGIPVERFQALLERLELLYSVENPYHCALHAADVLAATHCLQSCPTARSTTSR